MKTNIRLYLFVLTYVVFCLMYVVRQKVVCRDLVFEAAIQLEFEVRLV